MNHADKMLEALDGGKKWIKGRLALGDHYCIMGANAYCEPSMVDFRKTSDILDKVIIEQYPERVNGKLDTIPNFNDHPDTNWDDIRAVLEKVSTKLDEIV